MSWTPERIDELTKLWETGHSASAIGKLLGVSKNAVVGKAHRMKLQARPSPIKRGEDGGASSSASSTKAAARQNPMGAKAARSGSTAAAGKNGTKNEPLQTVISAALAAKSAGPNKAGGSSAGTPKTAAAATRAGPSANGARSAAQAAAKAVRGGTRGSVASAKRAVSASRRGPKCLWPIGDPGDEDFHFCGEPALSGKPYCAEHCARAYITRSRSDSAAA